ncbi:MAG: 50S ribosomal protein L32e [Methanoregula sp.]|nr:MAG: 50S ribosomal protein L32e [Methanoregula sp.]
MADEIRRLIQVRTQKGARFKRDGFGKKSQLSDSWRKPRGQHNKQREQKKAKGNLPKPGFGSPVAVRGMHPSGFYEVLVHSTDDLEGLDAKTQAVRIAAKVGNRKRAGIQEKALSAGLKILNARETTSSLKKTPAAPVKAKEEKPSKKEHEKTAKPKPAKKAKEAPRAKEEKKAPAKPDSKKTVKSGTAEEKPKKAKTPKIQKAKAEAAPEEKPKKSSKPKSESAKGTKTKPKAASKPATKPKRKAGTEVKDNE